MFNSSQMKPFYPEYEKNIYKFKSTPVHDTFVTEVISPHDPRSQQFCPPIKK